jgi:hypothetical protein
VRVSGEKAHFPPLSVKAVAMYDPVVFGRGVPAVLKVEKE